MTQPSLVVSVTGASGLVGRLLVDKLVADGHSVRRFVRRDPDAAHDEFRWDPAEGVLDVAGLRGADAVVNLAGENIAAGSWTDERKRRIRDSRVQGTRLIAERLAAMENPPRVLINASAIGYYGDRGDERLDEESKRGSGFLADTCVQWENATEAAERAGIRVVKVRIGIVLTPEGGALAKMLPIFRFGLGGPLGNGKQFMSWIGRSDLVQAIRFVLFNPELRGPVNAVAPTPMRNAEFTKVLARVLGRPAFLPAPAFAIRMMTGEMGREMVLAGARIFPDRLEKAGFVFEQPDLESALRHELGA